MPAQDALARLFGSEARIRILRLFLLNPNEVFDLETITARTHAQPAHIRRELPLLLDIGYVRKSTRTVTLELKGSTKTKRKKIPGYVLIREFSYLNELAQLLASHAPHARERLLAGMRGAGKVNLLIIAGRLLGYKTDHVDTFIVGDSIKKSKVERVLGTIEADMGKELVYAFMGTKEFQYRYGMQDRFIKDLFGNPHEILINKLGLG